MATTLPTSPPTTEIGTEQPWGGQPGSILGGVAPWHTFVDFFEDNPDLQWPNSVRVFQKMRIDSQLEALHYGATLPIRRYKWSIDPNGARPETVQRIAKNFNLPLKGEDAKPRPRMKDRFSWDRTLFHILLALAYGHMYFEIVGNIAPGPIWNLTRLGPRMPDGIQEIMTDDHGDLAGIRQLTGLLSDPLPAARLAPYVWDKEGANWAGRSMFRSCYRDWVAKDRLIRVNVIKHDRNGLGVPIAEAPPNASPAEIAQLNALAQNLRAGDYAGGAIPYQAKMALLGVQGALPDTLASIKYHDESMARRFLMMFMQLGQTETGSRALGGAFIDWFALGQEAIADWVVDQTTEHVIEPNVDWNEGPDEELTPRLHYERDEDTQLAAADLATLVSEGIITVDDELEEALRARYDLPAYESDKAKRTQVMKVDQNGNEINTTPPPPPSNKGSQEGDQAAGEQGGGPAAKTSGVQRPERRSERRVARVVAAAPSAVELPDRKLRREPYEQEVKAAVNFKTLDTTWADGVKSLIKSWSNVRATQINQLHDQIVDADGDLAKLAALAADAIGADVIETHLHTMAAKGVEAAIDEANKQGVTIEKPDMATANARLSKRADAVDSLLARSLSEAASRRAVAVTGGAALGPKDVAADVRDHLSDMSDTWLGDQFGGALSSALNAGRKETIDDGPPADIYASELLDTNTCDPCEEVDGTQYSTVDDAEADYPTGGFIDCLGGPRCRGTVIAVYQEQTSEQ